MQTKFKSGVNLFLVIFLVVFHIVILLLLTSPIFADTKVGLRFGIFLLIVDAALILPLPFATCYEVREEYLYIRDWPFRVFKIPYGDIISVEDGDFEAKHKKIVALSMNRIAVGYHKQIKHRKQETETIEEYIYISPADISSFLLRLSGKMQIGEEQAKEKAAEIALKQAEHNRKKKEAQLARKQKKEEEQPEIIVMSGNVKTGSVELQGEQTLSESEKNDTDS
ncbi:MAG: hypothetical protein ACI4K9_01225 [Candidatus Fimenecus sp.]